MSNGVALKSLKSNIQLYITQDGKTVSPYINHFRSLDPNLFIFKMRDQALRRWLRK